MSNTIVSLWAEIDENYSTREVSMSNTIVSLWSQIDENDSMSEVHQLSPFL